MLDVYKIQMFRNKTTNDMSPFPRSPGSRFNKPARLYTIQVHISPGCLYIYLYCSYLLLLCLDYICHTAGRLDQLN